MGKAPAFQFYPGDWSRDLEEHPLEIEGAWIRICCKLWWSETRGSLTRTIDQWAKILRVSQEDAKRIFDYINSWKIGEISVDPNGNLTVQSRRMLRDEKDRVNNCLRQKRHYEKRKPNATPTGEPNIPSSSSSSEKKKSKKEISPNGNGIVFDGSRFQGIPIHLLDKWREIGPGISVEQEIAKAEAWAMSNPKKRKSNWGKFITNWIIRAQDDPKPNIAPEKKPSW